MPFLQGYKSVKWLHMIRAFRKDPVGNKRLLGRSRTAVLGTDGQVKAGVVVSRPNNGETSVDIYRFAPRYRPINFPETIII